MSTRMISPFEDVALPMLVGPNSALKLKAEPKKLKNLLAFVVDKMKDENKTPYEIAEMVVLTAIMEMDNHEAKKKALGDFLATPMTIEAFLMRGRPSPYLERRTRILPSWMDERLLRLIPLTIWAEDGPMWDAKSKEQIHYVAQLLWNQDVAHSKKDNRGRRVSQEHSRLQREFEQEESRLQKEYEEALKILARRART